MAIIKPITWAEGYFVSDDGRIYSCKRGYDMKEKVTNGKGDYAVVGLMIDGKPSRPLSVHRIVAEFFCENPHKKQHVNHIDGNKRNNSASNLEWVTPFENFKHARRTGLLRSKLSDDDVMEIRELKRQGASHSSVAKMFGIDQSMVSLIWSRKRYQWLA